MTEATGKKKNRATLNLHMGWVGLVGLVGTLAGKLLSPDASWPVFFIIGMVAALFTVFLTRKSDEYTLSLWTSSVNVGFIVLIFGVIFFPFLEGFYDGLTGDERGQDFPSDGVSYVSILAFFLTFNIKRLTGSF